MPRHGVMYRLFCPTNGYGGQDAASRCLTITRDSIKCATTMSNIDTEQSRLRLCLPAPPLCYGDVAIPQGYSSVRIPSKPSPLHPQTDSRNYGPLRRRPLLRCTSRRGKSPSPYTRFAAKGAAPRLRGDSGGTGQQFARQKLRDIEDASRPHPY